MCLTHKLARRAIDKRSYCRIHTLLCFSLSSWSDLVKSKGVIHCRLKYSNFRILSVQSKGSTNKKQKSPVQCVFPEPVRSHAGFGCLHGCVTHRTNDANSASKRRYFSGSKEILLSRFPSLKLFLLYFALSWVANRSPQTSLSDPFISLLLECAGLPLTELMHCGGRDRFRYLRRRRTWAPQRRRSEGG